jgi:tripartite-type tricarboxylate transporter receptor subunit TctC
VFLVAPAGTPAAVIEKLSKAVRDGIAAPEVQENFAKQGATPTPSSPEELGLRIQEETRRWAAVVKEAGIKVE